MTSPNGRTTTLPATVPTNGHNPAPLGEFTRTGWLAPSNLTFDQWEQYGLVLRDISEGLNWAVGDWLAVGEGRWGEMYAQAMNIVGWDTGRLMTAKWVSKAVPRNVRNPDLSWSHHRAVAIFEAPEEQQEWLEKAAEEEMGANALREEIREFKGLPAPKNPCVMAQEWLVAIRDRDICLELAREEGFEYVRSYWSDELAWLDAAVFLAEKFRPVIVVGDRED